MSFGGDQKFLIAFSGQLKEALDKKGFYRMREKSVSASLLEHLKTEFSCSRVESACDHHCDRDCCFDGSGGLCGHNFVEHDDCGGGKWLVFTKFGMEENS